MSEVAAWPPGRGTLSVPLDGRRSAAAGLALDGPSRPLPLLVNAAAWAAARTIGPLALRPFRRAAAPAEPAFDAVLDELRRALGPFDAVAVHRPRQEARVHRALLLLRGGEPTAFVKVRDEGVDRDGEGIEAEQRALAAVAGGPLAGVRVPRPLGSGVVEGTGLAWGASSPLPARPHRPVLDDDLGPLARAISAALEPLPRPAETPDRWAPCHGDLTPWNLRAVLGAGRWLFDWERACWAPPHADLVLAAAARSGLGRALTPVPGGAEAAAWWRARLGVPTPDDPMAARLDDGLRALARA